ncbi:MAG: hypothetical protein V4714_22420 [Bacteroidota bacterium]
MLPLEDPHWKSFTAGYGIEYDASVPLRQLEQAKTSAERKPIFKELWGELHHQGDVGVASYLAVPHLIRIAREQKIADWNILALVAVIEIARHQENPPLPKEYEKDYLQSLSGVIEIVNLNHSNPWDRSYTSSALAAIAASKGQLDMAKVILELEDEELTDKFDAFLENY